MKSLAKFSVDKAITVFMTVVLVVVFGIVSYSRLSTDLFPSMNIPYSVVVTTYIGASPEEVEDVVTEPLEEVLSTTTNIASVESSSQENFSLIILEFNSDANMDSAVIEMRENLDMVLSQMPDEVGSPMIIKLNPDMMPIMQFTVSRSDMDQQELTDFVNSEVLPQIERIGGVASVSVSGAYESELRLVIDEDKLAAVNAELDEKYNTLTMTTDGFPIKITKDYVTQMLQANNFEFPAGYMNVEGANYLVRVGDDFNDTREIENMPLIDLNTPMFQQIIQMMGMPDFELTTYTIKDVLQPVMVDGSELVEDGEVVYVNYINANEKEYSKLNGDTAISITVQKSSNFATTDVTDEILEALDVMDNDGVTDFTVLLNQGEYIEQATGSVTNNLLYGALLAILILIFFLRSARATLIVTLAIPISLMFAIVLIYLSGITLNIVSLGGLALGIGMLVDNSIVVMENIFRMKKNGSSNREAAIEGTTQVGGAIIASTITTIAVFLPIIFIEGFIKEIFMQMALTIAFSLIASLMVALTLVPAISSKILKEESNNEVEKVTSLDKIKNGYEKLFNFAFKYKFVVLIGVLVLFIASIGLSLRNGFEYFPASDEGQLSVSIEKDITVADPLSDEEFTALLDTLTTEVLEIEDVDTIGVTLGSIQNSFLGFSGSDSASASVILKDDRDLSTLEVQEMLYEILEDDKYEKIEFDISGSQQQTAMLTGSGVQIQLKGYDLDELKYEAQMIALELEGIEGLTEVDSGVGKESKEIKITVDKEKAAQNYLSNAQILGAVAEAYAYESVVTSITMSGTIFDIYVYDKDSIDETVEFTQADILALKIMNPMGVEVPLSELIDYDAYEISDPNDPNFTLVQSGFTVINRVDGTRTVTVSANYEEGVNTTNVSNDVTEMMDKYNMTGEVSYEILGEQEETMEAVEILILAMGLAVLLIYMVMASQFQSLTYPFIIMFTIPLAFTGGFLILWLANMTVSIVAIIGLIILIGVVVNNGIVLVDYTNQLRETGLDVKDALLEAGKTRLRPIVMTALTTILALSTMALGIGEGAEMMQPMAVTTIGGLLYATVLTLLVVPVMYYLVTQYGKYIFGYGFGVILILIAVGLIVSGMILPFIITLVLAAGVIVYTFFYIRRGSDLLE